MRELYRVGRIAGLDVGERRIGVAVSDATGTLARPRGCRPTAGLDKDALDRAATKIARLAEEEDAGWSHSSSACLAGSMDPQTT